MSSVTDLTNQLAALEVASEARENAIWLILNGITILGMQFGFALLEAGCTAVSEEYAKSRLCSNHAWGPHASGCFHSPRLRQPS